MDHSLNLRVYSFSAKAFPYNEENSRMNRIIRIWCYAVENSKQRLTRFSAPEVRWILAGGGA
jgi:hypothetical protein